MIPTEVSSQLVSIAKVFTIYTINNKIAFISKHYLLFLTYRSIIKTSQISNLFFTKKIMSKKILTLQKPSQETNENMGKDIPIATKKTLNIKSDKEKKTEKLKQLSEWIGDITQTERQQKETAKKISEALQKIVDMQNNEATGYQKNFDIWLGEKMEHKIRKQYFPGKNKEEILLLAKNDENIQNKFKEYTKACQIKNEI